MLKKIFILFVAFIILGLFVIMNYESKESIYLNIDDSNISTINLNIKDIKSDDFKTIQLSLKDEKEISDIVSLLNKTKYHEIEDKNFYESPLASIAIIYNNEDKIKLSFQLNKISINKNNGSTDTYGMSVTSYKKLLSKIKGIEH